MGTCSFQRGWGVGTVLSQGKGRRSLSSVPIQVPEAVPCGEERRKAPHPTESPAPEQHQYFDTNVRVSLILLVSVTDIAGRVLLELPEL